jgi:hypothetical protein
MVKCEMYEAKKAFYEKDIIVCSIKRGTCPYNNEGHKLRCTDGISRIICKANAAEVGNAGLIKNLED